MVFLHSTQSLRASERAVRWGRDPVAWGPWCTLQTLCCGSMDLGPRPWLQHVAAAIGCLHPVSSCLLLSLGGFLWQMVEPATLPAFFFWSVSKAGDDWDGFWGFLGDILPATWLCEKIGCSEITVDYHCFPHQMVNCQDMFFLMLSLPDLVGFLRATPRGLTQVWHRHCDPHRCERDLSGHRVSWRSGLGPWDFARWNLEKSEDYGRFVRASDSKCPKNSIVSGYLNYDLWIFMKNYTDFYGFVLNLGDTAMKVVIFSLVHMMINHGIFGGALFSDKPNWGK